MRLLASLFAIPLLTLACTSEARDATPAPPPPTPTAATGSPTAEAPARTPPGALIQNYGTLDSAPTRTSRIGDSALLSIHPTTGAVLDEQTLILHRYAHRFTPSPDGRTLAFLTRPTSTTPEVQLLDISSPGPPQPTDPIKWTEDPSDGENVSLGTFIWSADSTRLYWFRSQNFTKAQLWSLDVETLEGGPLATVASWADPLLSPDGRLIYLFGGSCCSSNSSVTPFVFAIDTTTGETVDRAELPGLIFGSRPGATDESLITLKPGVAITPDGARIYIAHADSERVTAIDTNPLRPQPPEVVQRPQPLAGRLASWLLDQFVTRAEAKPMPHTRIARTSNDGRLLYVTGDDYTPCPNNPYTSCISGEPFGLQLIDLESMQLIRHEPGIERFLLTPNGRWLIGVGDITYWSNDEQRTITDALGLKVLDATTGQLAAHLEPGAFIEDIAISPDSRHLYYLSDPRDPRCPTPCRTLTVVDLETTEVIATQRFGPRPIGLVSLAPAP
jgi:WD40 repeat protein